MITERIIEYINYKGITKYKFCKDLGFSNGFLDKKREITTDKYANILEYFPELNPEWLLTGKGEMLNGAECAEIERGKNKLIPLYDAETIGGINERVANIEGGSSVSEWIDTGSWFLDSTAAIRHYGESMTEYPSGCILALREIHDYRLIVWGKNYVIETDEFRVTKRLQRGKEPNSIRAYSSNEEKYEDGTLIHEPIDIHLSAIRHLALVLGCVIKEQSSGMVYSIKK